MLVGVDALTHLIEQWREAAEVARKLSDQYDLTDDYAGNAHAFRKERRIWTTCADQVAALLAGHETTKPRFQIDDRGERDYLAYALHNIKAAIVKEEDAPCASAEHAKAAQVALQLERVPTYEEIVTQWKREADAGHETTPGEQTMTACQIGVYCRKHGFIHGGEAEELRKRVEAILDQVDHEGDDAAEAMDRALRVMLDDVDARDSVAFLEHCWKDPSALPGHETPPPPTLSAVVDGRCGCTCCTERTKSIYRMVGACYNCGTKNILMLFRVGDPAAAQDCPICGMWHTVHSQRLATADEIPSAVGVAPPAHPVENKEKR